MFVFESSSSIFTIFPYCLADCAVAYEKSSEPNKIKRTGTDSIYYAFDIT